MRILSISPVASHDPSSGAKARIYGILDYLKTRGDEVFFVYTGHEGNTPGAIEKMEAEWDGVYDVPFTQPYNKSCGLDYGIDDWVDDSTMDRVRGIIEEVQPDLIILHFVFVTKYVNVIPKHIPTIIDTNDRLSRRHVYEEHGMEPGFFYTTKEQEMVGLKRGSIVLAIQDLEAKYFAKSKRPTLSIGHVRKPEFVDRKFDRLVKIGIVAAYNKFNIAALEDFLPRLMTQLNDKGIDLEVHIAGNVCKALNIVDDKIKYRGFVHSLPEFYNEVDLIVNPTLIGTGLKIKTVEALAFGMPLVCTKVSYEGLEARSKFHNCEDSDALVEAIIEIYHNQFSILSKLSNLSRSIYVEYWQNLKHNLDVIFNPLMVKAASKNRLRSYVKNNMSALIGPSAPSFKRINEFKATYPKLKFAHMINPVSLPETSDLYLAQPLTFESFKYAKQCARSSIYVKQVAAVYEEDREFASQADVFDEIYEMDQSVLDVGNFEVPRKLPLIRDILEPLKNSDSDYVIYTNADIGLMPDFYNYIASKIEQGADALIINRRTISKKFSDVSNLSDIFASLGKNHPGYDCFVFRRELLEKMEYGDICVGVHLIGRVLLWNLIALSRSPEILLDAHATFHIGDDISSKDVRQMSFIRHNAAQATQVRRVLNERENLDAKLQKYKNIELKSLRFGARLFVEYKDGKLINPLSKDVHIHCLFRSGSTYLWKKCRKHKHVRAFYEPLHDQLNSIRLKNLTEKQKSLSLDNYHKQGASDWMFAEYLSLLRSDPKGNISKFKPSFSYFHYCDLEEKQIEEHKLYIDSLKQSSSEDQVVLQYNRSSLRQKELKHLYPDDLHIYLMRDRFSQWKSYLSKESNGVYGFVRNVLMIAILNRDKPSLKRLLDLIYLPDLEGKYIAPFQLMDKFYPLYSTEELYLIFYAQWMLSILQALTHSDYIVDMKRMSNDSIYRSAVEFEFCIANLEINLKDANLPETPDEIKGVDKKSRIKIEKTVNTIFKAEIQAALKEHGDKLPNETLEKLLRTKTRKDHYFKGASLKKKREIKDVLSSFVQSRKKLKAVIKPADSVIAKKVEKKFGVVFTLTPKENFELFNDGWSQNEVTHVWSTQQTSSVKIADIRNDYNSIKVYSLSLIHI